MDAQVDVVLNVIEYVADFRSKEIQKRARSASGSLSESESIGYDPTGVDTDSEPDTVCSPLIAVSTAD